MYLPLDVCAYESMLVFRVIMTVVTSTVFARFTPRMNIHYNRVAHVIPHMSASTK